MSSAAIAFVHAVCKRSQKCLAQKVVRFGSLGWIPMIQVPFHSSCVALQYKTKTKFFHRAVPELHGIKNRKISVQPRGILHVFSKFCRVSDDLSSKYQGWECSSSFQGVDIIIQMVSFFLYSNFQERIWTELFGIVQLACVRLASNPGSLGIQGQCEAST